jgi:hypothetical protein
MSMVRCPFWIALCGAGGGVAACFHRDAVVLPRFDKRTKIWKPGAIGTILIGAVAAVLIWCLYGPASAYDFVSVAPKMFSMTLSQLGSSFLIGFVGGEGPNLVGSAKGRSIHER